MRQALQWLRAQDRNDLAFWFGLLMVFSGLAIGVSVATALVWVGGALALEAVITSYLASFLRRP